jgi:hypothetical protein
MSIAGELARFVTGTSVNDLPPVALERARMVVASTIASAAMGADIVSSGIIRELAKERGGAPEATLWFDGGRCFDTVKAVSKLTRLLHWRFRRNGADGAAGAHWCVRVHVSTDDLEQDSPQPLERGLRRRMPSSVLDCRPHDISSRRRPWLT